MIAMTRRMQRRARRDRDRLADPGSLYLARRYLGLDQDADNRP
jgi:hypothetical protein